MLLCSGQHAERAPTNPSSWALSTAELDRQVERRIKMLDGRYLQ